MYTCNEKLRLTFYFLETILNFFSEVKEHLSKQAGRLNDTIENIAIYIGVGIGILIFLYLAYKIWKQQKKNQRNNSDTGEMIARIVKEIKKG